YALYHCLTAEGVETNNLLGVGLGELVVETLLGERTLAFNIRPVPEGADEDSNPNDFVPTQDRFDMGVSLKLFERKVTAAFNAINVTDEDLFDNFSIPRPGRNFNFKLIYEISNF
ncbi:MAG: hypothetical protein AAF901_13330, partial [Bacteroidota bacterium]